MSQELGYQSYIDQPAVSARLIVAGIGLLLLGLCGVCIVAMMPFMLVASATPALPSNPTLKLSMIFSSLLVLGMTIVVIWTGIACFLGKRWVRPIVLIFSALGVAFAVPMVVLMIVAMLQQPRPIGPPPWAVVFGIGFSIMVYLGFPLAYLLMFWPKHVQDLLDRLDPKPRWTDGIPVPLLGMSLVTLVLGIQLPWMVIVMPRPMLFAVAMPQLVAALPIIALMITQLVAAYWLYRQSVAGWWLAVSIVMLLSLSNLTNLLVYREHLYDQAFGPQFSTQVAQSPIGSVTSQIVVQCVWIAVLLTAAIWVKVCCLKTSRETGFEAMVAPPPPAEL